MAACRSTLLVAVAIGTTTAFASARAAAQGAERSELIESSVPKPAPPPEPEAPPGEPPRARTGFQVAFRTGAAFPAGKVSAATASDEDGDALSDTFGWQVPLLVELGGKPIPWLFVGVYAGAGFGGVSSAYEKECSRAGVSCSSRTLRIGIEGIVHMLPASWLDPWVGYGIGYESTTFVGEARNIALTDSLSGLELAHFMAGLDVRISKTFGVGPYLDVAIGRYGSLHRDATRLSPAVDRDIEKTAFHEWITLGARLVVLP